MKPASQLWANRKEQTRAFMLENMVSWLWADVQFCIVFYSILSIPTFFVLRAIFKGLRGSLVMASLSIPGLTLFLFAAFYPSAYAKPFGWQRLSAVLHDCPDLCGSAAAAALCAIQLVLVASKRLKDPRVFSLRTIGTSIVMVLLFCTFWNRVFTEEALDHQP
jgi:hypothetical protein